MANNYNKTVPRAAVGAFYNQEDCDIALSVTSAKETGYDFIILPITRSSYKRFLFDQINDNIIDKDKQYMEEWRKGRPFLKDDLIIKNNGKLNFLFYVNILS